MLDANVSKRFEDALASGRLLELAEQMTSEGFSQAATYLLFESFWRFLGEAKREQDEEILYECLESIVGYTSPGSKWFDHYLTNEEIDSHRGTASPPQ